MIITTGDVDVEPLLSLPYGEILVNRNGSIFRWDWMARELRYVRFTHDRQVFNRYATTRYSDKQVFYFQDDDVLLDGKAHDALLLAYNARAHKDIWVTNTQPGLDDAQGYYDLALPGCGSIVPRGAWHVPLLRYRGKYGNERVNLDCDFIFGVLSHWQKLDLGLEVRPEASAPGRLSMQPGQLEAKHASINKARALRTVVLTMLTLNEQENVVRALSSARPLYDKVLIHDTGSTDDTVLEVSRWCAANGVPLTVRNRPFDGFGHNRQALLDDARTMADFSLLMDADEEIIGDVNRPVLFADGYLFHYNGTFDYAQPRLIYNNFPWKWSGAKRHAALGGKAHDGRYDINSDVRGLTIKHHGTDNSTEARYRADISALSDDIEAGRDVARSLFMRAKAFEGLAEVTGDDKWWSRAASDYRRRANMSWGDEEGFYARFRLGCLLCEKLGDTGSGLFSLLTAWRERPTRAEPLRALSDYSTALADTLPYPHEDTLLIHRESYKTKE